METIHNYERRMQNLVNRVYKADIPEENKQLMIKFDQAMLLLENLSLPRRIKLLESVLALAKNLLRKNFKEIQIDDIKDCLRALEERDYSPWTKSGYKVTIKKFFKWLILGDKENETKEYPELVKWIRIIVKRKDQPRVQASAILTTQEIEKLISVAFLPRDRAFISILYELGARISEVGNLRIKDFTRDEYSYIVDLSGKTGHRTPRIVISDPYVTEWLNSHPLRDNPEAPVWVFHDNSTHTFKKLNYPGLRAIVLRLKEKAGIKKRVYTHLFRHSRVTHLLAKGLINEAQAKVYFGWTPDSKMLAEYSHLICGDANDAMLQINGIKKKEETIVVQTKKCPRCQRINTPDAKFCVFCSSVLDEKEAFLQDKEKAVTDILLNMLLKDSEVQNRLSKILNGMELSKLKEII